MEKAIKVTSLVALVVVTVTFIVWLSLQVAPYLATQAQIVQGVNNLAQGQNQLAQRVQVLEQENGSQKGK